MLEIFERLALAAGREVMRVFHAGCAVDRKSDASPVTEADRESEKIILAGLRSAFPDIPCVAEEEGIRRHVLPDLDGFLSSIRSTAPRIRQPPYRFPPSTSRLSAMACRSRCRLCPCSGRFSGRPGRAEAIEVDDDTRSQADGRSRENGRGTIGRRRQPLPTTRRKPKPIFAISVPPNRFGSVRR